MKEITDLRNSIIELEKEKDLLERKINEAKKKLELELIEKYGFFKGAIIETKIPGTTRVKTYIIRAFDIGYNEFLENPDLDLKAHVFEINKSNKKDKKKVIYDSIFISKYTVIGTYDSEKDLINYIL